MVFHGEALLEPDPTKRYVIQKDSPLSESLIWKWLELYYKQMAETAWSTNEVPMFISSNARLCRDYAALVFAYMRDYFSTGQKGPIYILELGAGHGRFTYLFTRALLSLKPVMDSLGFPEKPFVVVFTDVAMGNIEACRQREGMQKFIQDGVLDFMVFNCDKPDSMEMQLLIADRCIEKGSPLIAIGNYVMDSLLTDAIRIIPDLKTKTAKLYVARLSVYVSETVGESIKDTDPQTQPQLLPKATFGWRYEEVDFTQLDASLQADLKDRQCPPFCLGNDFGDLEAKLTIPPPCPDTMPNEIMASKTAPPKWMVDDPGVLKMIRAYQRQCVEMGVPISMTIPLGALRTIAFLRCYSDDRFLTIIGDKGSSAMSNLCGLRHPHMAIHGTISFGCNFYALKSYAQTIGGFHFSTPFKGSFHVTCLCFGSSAFPSVGAHMTSRWQDLDADNLIAVMQAASQLEDSLKAIPLRLLSSLMRLSCHDPDVISTYRKSLMANCEPPEMTPLVQPEMLLDIANVYANWFPLRLNDDDLPELCAHMCLKMGRAAEAIFYFREFLRRCPSQVTASTLINFAGCLRAVGDIDEANAVVAHSLQRWPDYEPAKSLQITLQMCQSPLKMMIVGCNRFAYDLAPFLKSDERCKVVGVSDVSTEASENLMEILSLTKTSALRPYSKKLFDIINGDQTDIILLDIADPQEWMSKLKEAWEIGVHVISTRRVDLSTNEIVDLLKSLNKINRERHQKGQHVLMWYVHVKELMEEFPTWLPSRNLGSIKAISINSRIIRHTNIPATDQQYIYEELARTVELAKIISGRTLEHLGLTPDTHSQAAAGWMQLVDSKAQEDSSETSTKDSCAVSFTVVLADSGLASTRMSICGTDGKLDVSGQSCFWEFAPSLVSTSKMSRKKHFTTPTQNTLTAALTTAHGLNHGRHVCLSRETVESLTCLTSSSSAIEALKLSAAKGGIAVTTNSKVKTQSKASSTTRTNGAPLLSV